METAPTVTGPINLGNACEVRIRVLADLIRKLATSKSEIVYGGAAPEDPARRCPDISLADEILDWHPTTKLTEGLKATIRYMAEIS